MAWRLTQTRSGATKGEHSGILSARPRPLFHESGRRDVTYEPRNCHRPLGNFRLAGWRKNQVWKTLVRTGSGLTRSGKVSAKSRKWKHCLRKIFGESRKWKHCIRKFFSETVTAGTGLDETFSSRVSGNTVSKKSFSRHFRTEPVRKTLVRTAFLKTSPARPTGYAKLARSCVSAALQRTASRWRMFGGGAFPETNRSRDGPSNP